MAKTRSAEGSGSEILIAGKAYRLETGAGAARTLPKGAGCDKAARTLPGGASRGNAARTKPLDR
jgi:hypothetical protein